MNVIIIMFWLWLLYMGLSIELIEEERREGGRKGWREGIWLMSQGRDFSLSAPTAYLSWRSIKLCEGVQSQWWIRKTQRLEENERPDAFSREQIANTCSIFKVIYSLNLQLFMITLLYTRHWARLSVYGVNRTDMISALTKLTVRQEGQAPEK